MNRHLINQSIIICDAAKHDPMGFDAFVTKRIWMGLLSTDLRSKGRVQGNYAFKRKFYRAREI